MVVTLNEGHILKKYLTKGIYIQGFVSIPALSSVNLSYNPPDKTVWIPVAVFMGNVQYLGFAVKGWVDGTQFFNEIYSMVGLKNYLELSVAIPDVIKELKLQLTNIDLYAHDADFMFFGILIPQEKYEEFKKELGSDETIISELRQISSKLNDLKGMGDKIEALKKGEAVQGRRRA